ncbi:MAG: hypothetical protein C5B50_03675 [Verrucomicrobia bacterium]|nr:MAG: hypothetical protein C5B50_03675 [Verrucomicrobiota bacterium]
MKNPLVWCAAALLGFSLQSVAEQQWKVHEWGTFTSLQDETGEAIGGINTDDEPVPSFVHRLAGSLLLSPTEVPPMLFKGAPGCHPDVTMRLETPVVYFHSPDPTDHVQSARVKVSFRGGWLTEFYPDAKPEAAGITPGLWRFPSLSANTEGKLEWDNLQAGGDWPLTNTADHVWTSPRAVDAALLRTAGGESERFLFYRGVAHIDAPLKVSREINTGELLIRSHIPRLLSCPTLGIRSVWLVEIQPGGHTAFRSLPPLTLNQGPEQTLAHTPATFAQDEFRPGNLEKLKTALRSALISEGLFGDEAQALLNTWELSYFKSVGLRLFFVVPRRWTDFYLPLEISPAAEIQRVMVGRIELVTPQQRSLLRALAQFSPNTIREQAAQLCAQLQNAFYDNLPRMNKDLAALDAGQKSLSTFVSIPKSYQTYLDLGRFRNALILNEEKRKPTEGLTNFIATYRLEAYQPVGQTAAN